MAYSYDVIVPVGAVQVILAFLRPVVVVVAVGVPAIILGGKILCDIIRTLFPSVTYNEPFISVVKP